MPTTRKKKQTVKTAASVKDASGPSKGTIEGGSARRTPAPPKGAVPRSLTAARRTKQRAGRAVAIYIDDGQGRRLVVAEANTDVTRPMLFDPVLIAMTQREAKDAIAVLRQLAEELPPESVAGDGVAGPSDEKDR